MSALNVPDVIVKLVPIDTLVKSFSISYPAMFTAFPSTLSPTVTFPPISRSPGVLNNVKAKLHNDVTNCVVCTWFNHWTTVLIEEHISIHRKVIPTIKNIKGIDIFFDGQPFDLKVTYLPNKYNLTSAIKNPTDLAIWMYENQGAQRFGDDNRLFIILLDKDNPERSWKLKRDFDLIFQKIDNFFSTETVSKKDEIVFSFGRRTYTAITKVLIITK